MEKFTIGLLLGMTAGALVVSNSYKMRALVKNCQEQVKGKWDEMIDEKLEETEKKKPESKKSKQSKEKESSKK